ncbi:MAG TPA: hypothetical protein VIC84_03520 [Blastocatellia bacterium]|jgi:hypothetical protein
MNIKSIRTIGKMTGLSFILGAAFVIGAVNNSSVFAQGLRDRDGRIDTRRELIEGRKGFNAGMIKGRADAIAHRKFSPFPHHLIVNNDFRQGFHKGYAQAYRQVAINRGHHFGRGF